MKKQKYRSLTNNEIGYLKPFFKDSLDYDKIKIYNRAYLPFLHPKNGGMAPDGNIYIRGNCYRDDYGKDAVSTDLKAFLLHEMVHVWQEQNKVMNLLTESLSENLKHNFNYNAAYYYELRNDKDLVDYGIEQQATILQDYFTLKETGSSSSTRLKNEKSENLIPLYEAVLENFLKDPKYGKTCPKSNTGKAYLKRKPSFYSDFH